MKKIITVLLVCLAINLSLVAQVDTTYIYNNNTPYGSLDIRLAKSPTWYYYLQEGSTFSYREEAPGVKTNRYYDMTSSWDSSPYMEGQLREKKDGTDLFNMNYRLLPPLNYDASYDPGYPLILVMHGLGERANCKDNTCYHGDRTYDPNLNNPPAPTDSTLRLLNNDHQLTQGGRFHLRARNDAEGKLPNDASLGDRDFPGFVLFPQNLNGWNVNEVHNVLRLVRLIAKKYNIDQNRIYIEGISNGGHGAYEAVKRAPWMFAAAVMMSAVDDGNITNQRMASEVSHIPFWIFQGDMDEQPTPKRTENFIKVLRDAGTTVRYTMYDHLGHGTWNTAFDEPDFFTWLLGKNQVDLHVFADNPVVCNDNGLRLEVAKGFKAYQWQFNGQLIDGANEAIYTAMNTGTYRARFARVENPSEGEWEAWSEPVTVTQQSVEQAEMAQIGTVLLNDLNGNANAKLYAAKESDLYFWYKNGTLLTFPGDQNDTIKSITLTPANGNGVYTLVTSSYDQCKSPPSEGKYVFFNDSAPVNITAPTNFNAQVNSASEVTLSWADASNNETGFEIWRREMTGESAFSPWVLSTLTEANITSFKDSGLTPSATHQYKIRAVSTEGRSEYTPSGENSFLTVGTEDDNIAPDSPSDLSATAAGIQSFILSWSPATDNAGIYEYIITYGAETINTASVDTTYRLSGVPLNSEITANVKAVDMAGNMGDESNSVTLNTYYSGVYYQHSTGLWDSLDAIDWANPEFTGFVSNFTLAPKTQDDFFNFRFEGYLYITNAGSYEFRTSSNDGSRLRLNDQLIVDNDGVHDLETVASPAQTLAEGSHFIAVDFFENIEGDSLKVEYKGPDTDNEWMIIPDEALRSSEEMVTDVTPDNGPEDSFVVKIFPNPTTQNNIHIQVESTSETPVMVRVLNPVGSKISEMEFAAGELQQGINLQPDQPLKEGMYILLVSQGSVVVKEKIIIK